MLTDTKEQARHWSQNNTRYAVGMLYCYSYERNLFQNNLDSTAHLRCPLKYK